MLDFSLRYQLSFRIFVSQSDARFLILLAFVVRGHRLCHAIVYNANARFSTGKVINSRSCGSLKIIYPKLCFEIMIDKYTVKP